MKQKQVISLLLALVLALGCFAPAFAEEAEAPQEIAEAIAEASPVEEEIPVIDETPVADDEEPAEELPVEEDDAERWSAAYARLVKRTDVYEDRTCRQTLGTLDADTVVYVFARYATADAAKDRMHIAFAVDGEIVTAWVRAKYLERLTDAEAAAMQDSVGDAEYQGLPLMNAVFAAAEAEEAEAEANAVPGYLLTTGITLLYDGKAIPKAGLSISAASEERIRIQAVASPAEAYQDTFIWTSTNPAVAAVDNDGRVTLSGIGTTTMKAEAMDGSGKSASFKLTVIAPAEDVEITGDKTVLGGKSVTLKAKVLPAAASNKKVTWKSSDESLATVTAAGKVTAKAVTEKKTIEITATAQDGYGAEGAFTLTIYPALQKLTLITEARGEIGKELNITMTDTDVLDENGVLYIGAIVYPYEAQGGYTLTSSNKKVAVPYDDNDAGNDETLGCLKILGAGITTITATATDGSRTKTSFQLNVSVKAESLSITVPGYDEQAVPIVEGKSVQLKAVFTPETATNRKVTWTSDNQAVLTVSASGKVSAVKGTAGQEATVTVVSAENTGITAEQKFVIVSAPTAVSVKLDGEEVKSSEKIVTDKETLILSASVAPETAAQAVTWKSSSTKVAEVTANEDGTATLTVLGAGTATITATTRDGSKSLKFFLTAGAATSAIVADGETDRTVAANQSVQLSVKAAPAGAKLPTIDWTTSDASVATVKNGKVTVKKGSEGKEVTITAQDKDKKLEPVAFTITVIPAATKVEWYAGDQAVSGTYKLLLKENGDETEVPLTAKITPDEAGQSVTYKSSNAKVVRAEGGRLTALKTGKATITATATDGSKKSAKITVQVYGEDNTIHIEGETEVAVGKSIQLKAVVDAGSAKKFTWTSSNTKIATVSSAGKVTAKSKTAGDKVTITCAPSDGYGEAAAIEITIIPAATGIEIRHEGEKLTAKTVALNAGNTFKLDAVVLPEATASQEVAWTSGNTKIAEVDQEGLVTFKTAGTVTVKAMTMDGTGKSATVKLTGVYLVERIDVVSTVEVIGGTKVKLDAVVYPANATNKKVTWTVSDKSVATVDKNGILTAKAVTEKKTVTVTAAATDGSGIVSNPNDPQVVIVYPQAAKVAFTEKTLELYEGTTADLMEILNITPAGSKHYISCTVSDATVAAADVKRDETSRDTEAIQVSALKVGTTKLTLTLDNNKKYSATLTVKVTERPLTMHIENSAENGMAADGEKVTWTVTPGFTDDVTFAYVLTKNSVELDRMENLTGTAYDWTMNGAGIYALTVTMTYGERTKTETSMVEVVGGDIVSDNGYVFEIQEDGAVAVAGYNGEAASLTIPADLAGVKVTAIADDAFMDNTAITSVAMPNTIEIIGERAFKNCTNLANITAY